MIDISRYLSFFGAIIFAGLVVGKKRFLPFAYHF